MAPLGNKVSVGSFHSKCLYFTPNSTLFKPSFQTFLISLSTGTMTTQHPFSKNNLVLEKGSSAFGLLTQPPPPFFFCHNSPFDSWKILLLTAVYINISFMTIGAFRSANLTSTGCLLYLVRDKNVLCLNFPPYLLLFLKEFVCL